MRIKFHSKNCSQNETTKPRAHTAFGLTFIRRKEKIPLIDQVLRTLVCPQYFEEENGSLSSWHCLVTEENLFGKLEWREN
eukprot:maker-scaffold_61-snap-gene-0.14-mRNA-1 protein AED:0.36 eAED:0.36 QI:0/0.25/0.2/1/0/0/5/171/79